MSFVLGYEIHHTHIHLVPTQSERDVIPLVPKIISHEELAQLAASLRTEQIYSTPTTSEVQAVWDAFAERFAQNHQPTTLKLACSAMDHLELEHASCVLEIGGGAGGSAAEIFKRIPEGARLITSDLSLNMLAIAKEHLNDDIEVRHADASNLPFEDEEFDRIFANLNLMIVPDPQQALKEANRVLKPQGLGVWTVWGRKEQSPLMTLMPEAAAAIGVKLPSSPRSNFHLSSKTKLKRMLTNAGFDHIQLWYQPMRASYEDAQTFANDMIEMRPELADLDKDQKDALYKELSSQAAEYFDSGAPISLEILVIRARKAQKSS